jgi:uncharacterized damage-inducible protein DinB
MSERARALADRLEQANNEMIAVVERTSDADWKADCPNEGRTVGVTAHHLAGGLRATAGWVHGIATGQPAAAVSWETVHQANARHAERYADVTREETLERLRANGAAAVRMIRGLSDEQLDREAEVFAGDGTITAEQLIENNLIGHVQSHLASVKQAVGAS